MRTSKEADRAYKRKWYEENQSRVRLKVLVRQTSLPYRYADLLQSAKRHNVTCSITKEQHYELLKRPCFYCRGPLNKTGSGLDRLIPNGAYTPDNVRQCCWTCNRMKGHMNFVDFVAKVKEIATRVA